jgi:transcriptional regulator with XRE-family HTH domain
MGAPAAPISSSRGATKHLTRAKADSANWRGLGEFIRSQRRLAQLSLRQMAELAQISNPYLSQVERGMFRPSAQVLKAIADTLKISAGSIYAQAGLLDEDAQERAGGVESAIRLDPALSTDQKETLTRVYRGFIEKAG